MQVHLDYATGSGQRTTVVMDTAGIVAKWQPPAGSKLAALCAAADAAEVARQQAAVDLAAAEAELERLTSIAASTAAIDAIVRIDAAGRLPAARSLVDLAQRQYAYRQSVEVQAAETLTNAVGGLLALPARIEHFKRMKEASAAATWGETWRHYRADMLEVS